MRLTFNGSAGMVTGSCHMLEAAGKRILVDCGMFQGPKEITALNYKKFGFDPKGIHCLLLTHAHIDHCGLIPKLVKSGFRGPVYATKPTVDLAAIMLEDSANVSREETIQENRRRQREGLPPRKPLYTVEDVKAAVSRFRPVQYGSTVNIGKGLSARFRDAGHILGSSAIEVDAQEGGRRVRIVFSGDLGQGGTPLMNDPERIEGADYAVVESTYGYKKHLPISTREVKLQEAVRDTHRRGGILMIPSFAVERTQEILYYLHRMERDGKLPQEHVFLDSPLAIEATNVFNNHMGDFSPALRREFKTPFTFKKLRFLKSIEDSKDMNEYDRPCIVIAGNGMCTAGRIKFHLKHHLWNPKNTLLFVGYQAEGTLGRIILEGAERVHLMGMDVAVKAKIMHIDSFSSHADAEGLERWLRTMRKRPKRVFLVHGEGSSAQALAEKLGKSGFRTHIPQLGESVEL